MSVNSISLKVKNLASENKPTKLLLSFQCAQTFVINLATERIFTGKKHTFQMITSHTHTLVIKTQI